MEIKNTNTHTIPEELLSFVAVKFGYIVGASNTPEQAIEEFYRHRNQDTVNRINEAIREYYGGARAEEAETVINSISHNVTTEVK